MRKSYIQKHFIDTEYLKEKCDIQNVGSYVGIDLADIEDEKKADYEPTDDGTGLVYVEYNNIMDDVKDGAKIDYDVGFWDQWHFTFFINSLIKNYGHYLIVSYNGRWDGATGYKIVEDKPDIFYRDYDVSQYAVGGSVGGKSLLFIESSHGSPCGHKVLAVGLTDNEFSRLDNATLEGVMAYAKKQYSGIIEV